MNSFESHFDVLGVRLQNNLNKVHIVEIAEEAVNDVAVLESLFRLMVEGGAALRWRAAWAIEKVSLLQPQLLETKRSEMMALAMSPDIADGHRRLLLSTLYNLPQCDELNILFFNFLLDVMVDLQASPGVQSLAMKLACRMSRVDDSLHEEFLCILRNMCLEYYSAGVRAVVRNCLKNSNKRMRARR